MGRCDEALPSMTRKFEIMRTRRTGLENEADDLTLLAEIHQGGGRLEPAEKIAREAVTIAEERGTAGWAIRARTALARILLESRAQEARAEIEALLERAAEGVDETGMHAQTLGIVETRARLAGRLGNPEACREGLADCLRIAREMGAFGDVQRLEAELTQS